MQSAPAGAKVISAPTTGTYATPTIRNLKRKHDYTLTFTSEGYDTATFRITNHVQAGFVVLGILGTGLIGVVVDAATGGWYALSPTSATVALTKTTAMGPGPDTIKIRVARVRRGSEVRVTSSVPDVRVMVTPRQ